MASVNVTVTVEVDGETRTATSAGQTDGDARRLAEGLVSSTCGDINSWLRFERYERRKQADK